MIIHFNFRHLVYLLAVLETNHADDKLALEIINLIRYTILSEIPDK